LHVAIAVAAGVLVLPWWIGIRGGFPHGLDASWQEGLNWAISHGAQWGKGWVFTYGPLGFIKPDIPFDPDTYWVVLLLQIVIAAAMAWLVAANVRRMPLATGVSLAIASLLIGPSSFMVYPLAALVLERTAQRKDPAGYPRHLLVGGLSAFTAIQPLIKFSVFPLWVVWLLLGAFMLWRSRNRSLVLTFVSTSIVAISVVWVACGQRLANLGAFVYWSWQIAVDYPAAMQLEPGHPVTNWVALGAIGFGLMCAVLFSLRVRHSPRRVAVYVMLVATLAVAYRAGATRADGGHLMIIWSACAWCAPLLAGLWYEDSGLRDTRRAVSVFVLSSLVLVLPWLSNAYSGRSLWSLYAGDWVLTRVVQQADELSHPFRTYRDKRKQWVEDRKALQLPIISGVVKDDTVDVLMDDQSSLLANGMHYRPRPVFQSYSAYSGKLAQLNSEFFLSTRAPQWVMLDWHAIDGHYPTSDDARALVTILQNYRPVLTEDSHLLFRRSTGVGTAFDIVRPEREIPLHFKLPTNLPAPSAGAWFAKVDVELTPYGKLYALLFRPPRLGIEVRLANGATNRYTLVRAIAKSGFVLSPALESNFDYLRWLGGDNKRYVTTVKLVQREVFNHRAFKIVGPLQLYPLKLPRRNQPTHALYAALFPGFSEIPTALSESSTVPTRIERIDGESVLLLPAPASLEFQLPPGTYAMTARFGVMPNALTNAACRAAHADGVGIEVRAEKGGHATATVSINPYKDPRHEYAATFSHEVTVGLGQPVVVSLTSGPRGSNGACDWSWIRGLRFTPVQGSPR